MLIKFRQDSGTGDVAVISRRDHIDRSEWWYCATCSAPDHLCNKQPAARNGFGVCSPCVPRACCAHGPSLGKGVSVVFDLMRH